MGKAASGNLTLQQKYELLRKKQAEREITKKENEVTSAEANTKLAEILIKKQQEEEKSAKPTVIKLPTNLQRALKNDPSALQRREVKPTPTPTVEEVRKIKRNSNMIHKLIKF